MTPQPPARSRAGLLLEQLEQLKEEPLSVIDAKLSVTVADEIALADAKIRRHIAYALMIVFTLVNFMTLLFLFFLFQKDQSDLTQKLISDDHLVINSHVVITLLGATTVQLGAVMVIMARYVFPTPKVDAGDG